MKYPFIAILAMATLTGCDDINYAKLGYQVKGCFADTTIRCNDVRIRFAIAETKIHRQSLEDNKDKAIAEIGQTNYERLLALFDQKIKHLQGQRPKFYLRWFQGDKEDYREIDQGWAIDAKIDALGNQIIQGINHTAQPNAPEHNEPPLTKQDATRLITAEVQTPDQIAATDYTMTVLAGMEMGEESISLETDQGTMVFHGDSLTIDQVNILQSLHRGDCLSIHTNEPFAENTHGVIELQSFRLSHGSGCQRLDSPIS